jgi:NADPH oxidase 2
LNCPEISPFEWHPFTLTSSPHEEFLSLHIRCVGDWTYAFARRLGCRFGGKEEDTLKSPANLPIVMVDGPYGSASEDVFDYEAVVLVGAGIGVTPFASILKTIWYRMNNPKSNIRLRKVYFYWVCRDKDVWFLLISFRFNY